MHFGTKSYLKSNRYHTVKHLLSETITTSTKNKKKKYIFNQKPNFLNYAFLFYFYKKNIYFFYEKRCALSKNLL